MSKGRKKVTLRSLFYKGLEPKDYEGIRSELFSGTDRSAALIGAAMLDAGLEAALRCCFVKFQDDSEHNAIFRAETAPLSTLASKLLIARSIGLFSYDAWRALNIIKDVRNVFAHSFLPLKFTEPLIAEECARLPEPPPERIKIAEGLPWQHPLRLRYVVACTLAASNLEGYAEDNGGHGIILRMSDDLLPTTPPPASPAKPE